MECQLVIGHASKAREQTLDECANFYVTGNLSGNVCDHGNVRSFAEGTLETGEIV